MPYSEENNMDVCEEINNLHDCGYLNCGIVDESLTLQELALGFELFFRPNLYFEISYQQAALLLIRILTPNLPYNSKNMYGVKAKELTTRFLNCFDEESAQYYTNGDLYDAQPIRGWTPATSAIFDTGILVISKLKAGCLWVEDDVFFSP